MPILPDTSRLSFVLSAAGIPIGVVCDQVHLLERLRQHYQAFLIADDEPVETILRVQVDRLFAPSNPDAPGVTFSYATGRFATRGCEGTIDREAGQAYLRLSVVQPFIDVDYCLRVIYALQAFHSGGLLFHGAGIVRAGSALLFFGHSGSGKTTVARLSPNDRILNDDLVLIMPTAHGWTVHATPFWNPTQVGPPAPGYAHLAALLRLVQAKDVLLDPMRPAQALAEVISCVPVMAVDESLTYELLQRTLRLLEHVPAYRLHFLPDASFWSAVERLVVC